MSQSQYDRAVTNLYEDDGIRGEMTDDEAQILLSWGEAQVTAVAAHDLPDSQFDAWCGQLRHLLGAVNRFVARRESLLHGDQAQMMRELRGLAQAAYYEIEPTELESFFDQQPALDHQMAISEILGLLKADVQRITTVEVVEAEAPPEVSLPPADESVVAAPEAAEPPPPDAPPAPPETDLPQGDAG